jgi:CBS domain-containing protein
MQVEQIMNQPAIVCRVDQPCDKAARLMAEHDCGVIPVVDHDDRIIGMVTDRDICMASLAQRLPIHTIRVKDAMTREPYSCSPTDSLDVAATRMKDAQVHRLPVVDDEDRVVGVLSTNDIFRQASLHRGQPSISDKKLVDTLAAICAPHRPVQLAERPRPSR